MKKKIYYGESYEGYPIKCNTNYPCYEEILAKLLRVIQVSKSRYVRPIGFHIRYRVKNSVDGRVVTDRLNKCFRNKNSGRMLKHTFSPCWLKVTEEDLLRDGEHHHLALIIEGKYATHASLHCLFAKLQKKYLQNYEIIKAWDESYASGVDLRTDKGVTYFFNWLSYIAKSNTKESIKQTYSTSRLS
ncbi:hypothetical protein [Idiomarina abyssalis]|uniref:hypothetical protein n=1 Tax=Idiomarina abyssalis TaxID=86102 RepID=UPI003A931FA4